MLTLSSPSKILPESAWKVQTQGTQDSKDLNLFIFIHFIQNQRNFQISAKRKNSLNLGNHRISRVTAIAISNSKMFIHEN